MVNEWGGGCERKNVRSDICRRHVLIKSVKILQRGDTEPIRTLRRFFATQPERSFGILMKKIFRSWMPAINILSTFLSTFLRTCHVMKERSLWVLTAGVQLSKLKRIKRDYFLVVRPLCRYWLAISLLSRAQRKFRPRLWVWLCNRKKTCRQPILSEHSCCW